MSTGALPDVQLAEWEDDNYTRPEYTVTPTVENLNSWARIAGSNEFDLADKGYGACLRYEASVLCRLLRMAPAVHARNGDVLL